MLRSRLGPGYALALLAVAHAALPLAAQSPAPAACSAAAPALPTDPLAGFDAYVEKAMREWEVPGAAVAIVRGGSVVLARGYGVRTLGRPERVDAHTQFAIASASKTFTATLLAMLVDEGKLRWDDRVTQHLPGFELQDPYVTRELTLRDLLSHRSGLPRGDFTWYATATPPAEVVRRVRFLAPNTSLRAQFGYQNILYLAAGEVIARAAGQPWDAVLQERLFRPLAMTASHTSTRHFARTANVATPHERIDDTVRVIAWRNWDNVGAAGAINSTVTDLARWVRFQLDSARVDGRPLVSAASFVETHTPHTLIRRDETARAINPFTHISAYGLGWFVEDYRGRQLVHHGGNLDGMASMVALMPSEDLGVAILTNLDASGLRDVLMRKIFDLYLGAPPRDWSAEVLQIRNGQLARAKETEKKREAERVAGTRPLLAPERYAGTYADSLYGQAEVKQEGERLVLHFGPSFVGDLEHWHFNTFRATWRDRSLGKTFVHFPMTTDARLAGLALDFGAGGSLEFRREEKADTTPAVRLSAAEQRRLLGAFRATDLPLVIRVEEVGGRLKLTVPGQPAYTLVALTATRFRLTGGSTPPGFFLQYTLQDGRVQGVTLEQPSPRPTLTFAPVR